MEAKIIELIKLAREDGYNLDDEVNIGDNIIIPSTSEDPWFYVRYNSEWYSVSFDWDDWYDEKYDNAEIYINDFGKDYYEEWYLNDNIGECPKESSMTLEVNLKTGETKLNKNKE